MMVQKNSTAAKAVNGRAKGPLPNAVAVPQVTKAAVLQAATAPQAPKAPAAKAPAAKAPAAKAATAARVAKAPSKKRKAPQPAAPTFDNLASLSQDNLAACVASGMIVSKGLESLRNEVINFAQASIDASLTAAQGLLSAETVHEVLAVQSGLAQDGVDRVTSETAKLGGMTMRVVTQAFEPIRTRIDANARNMGWPLGQ